jgi:HK97 family phage major capsid protein
MDRAALLRELRDKPQYVAIDLHRAAVDKQNRTVEVAFCSEEPYERWWGIEILDCAPDSVRMKRLNNKASVLVDHSSAKHVGVVETARLDRDRKGRANVRFGRSDFASEILQDVADGIRTKVSVGYMVHDLVLERKQEDLSTYRVTDWEPFEISIVSVPADDTVGIGRSQDLIRKAHIMEQRIDDGRDDATRRERALAAQQRANEQLSTLPADDAEAFREHVHALGEEHELGEAAVLRSLGPIARAYERWRVDQINACADRWQKQGNAAEIMKRAAAAALNPEVSLNKFRKEVLEMVSTSTKVNTGELEADRLGYGDAARVGERYGTLTHIKGKDAEARAHQAGMYFRSLVGDQRAAQWCRDKGLLQQRALGTGVFTAGGALIPDPIENEVINLREQFGVFSRFARMWPMENSALGIPVKTAGLSISALGEGTVTQTSDPAFAQVNLVAKEFGGGTRVHRNLIEDSPIALGDFIVGEFGRSLAEKEDNCGFVGIGTSTFGGMAGINFLLEDGNHAGGTVDAASPHNTFAEIDAVDLVNLMGRLPEYARAGAAWYLSNTARDMILTRLSMSAGGNTVETLRSGAGENFMGYPTRPSPVLPAGATTDYNDKVIVLFGNLSLSSAFGARRGVMIDIDSSRFIEYREIYFQATERFDIVNHHVGTATEAGPIVGLLGTT